MAECADGRALTDLLQAMKALLEGAGIPYMVVGSFASTVHGEPRTTLDLDLVIDPTPASLDLFLASVDMDAFYVDPDVARDALRARSMFNIVDMNSAWKADQIDWVNARDFDFGTARVIGHGSRCSYR